MARLNVGEVFPNFTVDTSSKNQVTIQELVKQKTVFWVIRYIGCTVCRYDVHLLAQKYDEIKDKGMPACYVDIDDLCEGYDNEAVLVTLKDSLIPDSYLSALIDKEVVLETQKLVLEKKLRLL